MPGTQRACPTNRWCLLLVKTLVVKGENSKSSHMLIPRAELSWGCSRDSPPTHTLIPSKGPGTPWAESVVAGTQPTAHSAPETCGGRQAGQTRLQMLHASSPCHHVEQMVAARRAPEGVLRSQGPAQAEAHALGLSTDGLLGQLGAAFPLSPLTWSSPA